jgi:hypothetical protein
MMMWVLYNVNPTVSSYSPRCKPLVAILKLTALIVFCRYSNNLLATLNCRHMLHRGSIMMFSSCWTEDLTFLSSGTTLKWASESDDSVFGSAEAPKSDCDCKVEIVVLDAVSLFPALRFFCSVLTVSASRNLKCKRKKSRPSNIREKDDLPSALPCDPAATKKSRPFPIFNAFIATSSFQCSIRLVHRYFIISTFLG